MAERTWTEAQRAAIENRDLSLAVSAAAGSGKTATLTERIIRQITDPCHPVKLSSLLVVTFTNAAAEELRTRIAEALRKKVAEFSGDLSAQALAERDRLERELLTVKTAKILTIDAFCNQLLRANAEAAGLAPNFRVGDTAELRLLAEAVLSDLIDGIYRDECPEVSTGKELEDLTDALTSVKDPDAILQIILYIYDRCQGEIDGVRSLLPLIDEYDPEKFTFPGETPYGEYAFRAGQELFAFARDRYDARIASLDRDHPAEGKAALFLEIERLGLARRAGASGFDEMQALYFETLFRTFPAFREKTPAIEEAQAERAALKEAIAALGKSAFLWTAEEWRAHYAAAHRLLLPLGKILCRFDALFSAEKRRRNLVDFSDLEHLTYSALVDERGETTPLARSLAASYSAVCIDEYQDVNALQDAIFRAVSREDNLFTVGDIKQCIYAFRGSDPSIFAAMKKNYPKLAEARAKGLPAASLFLSQNFRCDPPILSFVNGIFDSLFPLASSSLGHTKEDSLLVGKSPDACGRAIPEIHRVIRAKKKDAPGEAPVTSAEETAEKIIDEVTGEELSATELCANAVADRIASLLAGEAGEKKNDGSPILPSDIAILMRNNKGRAEVYAKALAARGIPTEIAEQGDFFLNPEVLLAISLLSAIDNPQRDIYLAGALCSPLFGYTGDDLLRLRRLGGDTLCEGLKRASLLEEATEEVPLPLAKKAGETLATLGKYRKISEGVRSDLFLARLYRETGLLALADAHGGKDNLLLLENYARTYEQSGYRGISGFLSYLGQIIREDISFGKGTGSANPDAVKILTAHKAKGLEYPVCFVTETQSRIENKDAKNRLRYLPGFGISLRERAEGGIALLNNAPHEILAMKQAASVYEEEMRVLYVALTRARERLYIYGTVKEEELAGQDALREERGSLSAYRAKHLKSFLEMALVSTGEYLLIDEEPEQADEAQAPETVRAGEDRFLLPEEPDFSEDFPALEEHSADEIAKTLTARFRYAYPDPAATRLPEKLSVSALSPSVLDGSEEERLSLTLEDYEKPGARKTLAELAEEEPSEAENNENEKNSLQKAQILPDFYTGIEKNESAKRGIATHTYLQFADFEHLKNSSAEEEKQRLCSLGFLSAEDAKRIRMKEICAFASSELFARLLGAKKVYRELRFHCRLPAEHFTRDPELAKALAGKRVLVQGVIDCLYEDAEGGLHLVDYKTDRLPRAAFSDPSLAAKILSEKHSLQLSYYAMAVRQMFGKEPKTVTVYSLALGREVKVSES